MKAYKCFRSSGMRKFLDFLSFFDIFGVGFNFAYESRYKFTSWGGGIFGVLLLVAIFAIGSIEIVSFIKRKESTISYYSYHKTDNQGIVFKDNNKAMFGYTVYCSTGLSENYSDYFQVYSVHSRRNASTYPYSEYTIMDSHQCQPEDIDLGKDFKSVSDEYTMNFLSLIQCLNLTAHDYEIKGDYTNIDYSYITTSMRIKPGLSEEDFQFALEQLKTGTCYLPFYYVDKEADLKQEKNPIQFYIHNTYIYADPNKLSTQILYLGIREFVLDNNWLFDKEDSDESYFIESSKDDYQYLDNNKMIREDPPVLAQIQLLATNNRMVIKRRYKKILEFSAEFGSLCSNLYVGFSLIASFINNILALRALIKGMFLIVYPDSKNQKISKKIRNLITDYMDKFKERNLIEEEKIIDIKEHKENLKIKRTEIKNPKKNPKKNPNLNSEENKINTSEEKEEIPVTNIEENQKEKKSKRPLTDIERSKGNKIFEIRKNSTKIILFYLCPCLPNQKKSIMYRLELESRFFVKLDVRTYLKNLKVVEFLSIGLLDDLRQVQNFGYACNPFISLSTPGLIESHIGDSYSLKESDIQRFLDMHQDLYKIRNQNGFYKSYYEFVTKNLEMIDIINRMNNKEYKKIF